MAIRIGQDDFADEPIRAIGRGERADRADTAGYIAVHVHARETYRHHQGFPGGLPVGQVGRHPGGAQCLQRDVHHHRVQQEVAGTRSGRRGQPHFGAGRTGLRDGEPDDAAERRSVLLAGAAQPLIQVVGVEFVR